MVIALVLGYATKAYAAPGDLDPSFDTDGKVMTDFSSSTDLGYELALQDDGRIVVAGYAPNGSNYDFALARYFGGNDATPPRVKPPVQSLPANSALGTTDVPIKLSWSATDSQGEVTRYQLQHSTDGDSYTNVSLPSATATARTVQLAPAHDYRFRVRATDDNGNTSSWKYGPRFTLDTHQKTSSAIAYAKSWKTQSPSSAYGGKLKYATKKGAKATLSFEGTNVAWVAPKSKEKVATVDLFSKKALSRQVVFSRAGLDPSVNHALEVRVLGKKRAAATSTRVDVDAFVVLR